ncbi:MAG TPA: alanine racemase [Candidatus Limnocylindrales bacterium]|nr:alanine racemase [Candidatus Limnocylindrales bacterium]
MISLYDLLEAANGQLFGEPHAHLFSEFALVPANAVESSLYVALSADARGMDAAVREAVARGASGLLAARPPDLDIEGLTVILVKNPGTALVQWATHVLNRLGLPVIAVAGVSGREITLHALDQVLRGRSSVLISPPEITGRLAIPLTLSRLTPEHQAVALAVDVTRPGEMAEAAGALRPRMAVLTSAGSAALGQFDGPEHLAAEMGLLLDYLHDDGLAILNYDDDLIRALAQRGRGRTLTISAAGQFGADVLAQNTVLGPTRTGFDLRYFDQKIVGRWTPLLGREQLFAALAALTIGEAFNVPLNDGLRALSEIAPLPGRMQPLAGVDGSLLIDDSWDAEPQSTLAALDWLAAAADSAARPVFVFADMDGLAGSSAHEHRLIGQRASAVAETLVTLGPNAAQAGRAALDSGMEAQQVAISYSPADTIAALRSGIGLSERDLVLIKGGAGARLERVTSALLASPADAVLLPRNAGVQALATEQALRPSWVEIDLNALAGNVRGIKSIIGPNVTLFAVVKADAYGHGAIAVARTALQNGAEWLAVANLAEALALRDAGLSAPILLMSALPAPSVREAIRHDLTATVYDLEQARAFDFAARDEGGRLRVHVMVDTGMGRLGVLASEAVAFFRQLMRLPNLEIEGIYTHFSRADDDIEYTAGQVRVFKDVLVPLRAAGFNFRYVHAANSAGTLASAANHFNAVRVGIALYGLSPSEQVRVPPSFRPVMCWKTQIAQVKTLPAGHAVGYGNTYITSGPERIAILPVGYADGLRRAPHHQGEVLVRGQLAPILGRVSMEKTIISVDHIHEAQMGDEVVLLGEQGERVLSADTIAERWGTISYEVVCSVLARVPR